MDEVVVTPGPIVGSVVIDGVLPERGLLAAVPAIEIDSQSTDFPTGRCPHLLLRPARRCFCLHRERRTDPLVLVCLVRVDLEGFVPAQNVLSSRGLDHSREKGLHARQTLLSRSSGRRLPAEDQGPQQGAGVADRGEEVGGGVGQEDEADPFRRNEADESADSLGAAVMLDDLLSIPGVRHPAEGVRHPGVDGDLRREELLESRRRHDLAIPDPAAAGKSRSHCAMSRAVDAMLPAGASA